MSILYDIFNQLSIYWFTIMNENEKIKQIRKALNLTQQELANNLGVSKQYLSKVEKGGTDLSKEKITLLCDTYDISLD